MRRLSDSYRISFNTWKMSRYAFFTIAGTVSFCWYWFPDFIFPALSTFNFPCWIAPKDKVVNQLFGMTSGMGLLPITFDCMLISTQWFSCRANITQGVRFRTLVLRCSSRLGPSSTFLCPLYFGSGLLLWPATTRMCGIPAIFHSRVRKVMGQCLLRLRNGADTSINFQISI